MVKPIPRPFERDKLVLRVEREKDDRIWYFDTEIPRDQWEDLFHVNAPDRPTMDIQEVYARAPEFWDYLAEKCANKMQKDITSGVPECHLSHTWPEFDSLEREYDRFRASGVVIVQAAERTRDTNTIRAAGAAKAELARREQKQRMDELVVQINAQKELIEKLIQSTHALSEQQAEDARKQADKQVTISKSATRAAWGAAIAAFLILAFNIAIYWPQLTGTLPNADKQKPVITEPQQ